MSSSHPISRRVIESALALLLFLAVAIGIQFAEHAYRCEFGGHPDEAAHYVTALMIRDYVASGFHGSPMAFAKDYYFHYPKVALGNWPPMFYLVQAPWMLIFSPSRVSILVLIALLAAGLATVIFHTLRQEYGLPVALCGGLFFLSLPLVQEFTGMVMAEMLTALLMLLATLAYGRYLEGEKARDAIAFGLLAAAALLTKGNAVALVFMASIGLAASNGWRLLKKPHLWIAAAIVLVLAGPWMWATREQTKAGWDEPSPSWHFTQQAIPYYLAKFAGSLGPVLLLLVVVGIVARVARRTERRGLWAALLGLMFGVIIFQWIAPVGKEARHLIPGIAAAILFAGAGLGWLVAKAERWPVLARVAPALILALTILSFWNSELRPKVTDGFEPVVARLDSDAAQSHAAILISSDARGEGMFIAELAMDEKRPGHSVERASKVLASSAWSGKGYHPKYNSPEEVRAYLLQSKVRFIVIDNSVPPIYRVAHHDQILQAVQGDAQHFQLVGEYPINRTGAPEKEAIRLYEVAGS